MGACRCLVWAIFSLFFASVSLASSKLELTPMPSGSEVQYSKIFFLGSSGDDVFDFDALDGQEYESDNQNCDGTYNKYCSSPLVGVGKSCAGRYQKCECHSSYDKTCNGADNLQPDGEECGGKYAKCKCDVEGVVCSGEEVCTEHTCEGSVCTKCECPPSFKHTCDGEYKPVPGQRSCGGKYESCLCNIENQLCQNNEVCEKTACGGTVCETCGCGGFYVYDNTNCNGDFAPRGEQCGGKYAKCECNRQAVACSAGQVCSSTGCHGSICTGCRCADNIRYNSGNCNGDYVPSGISCGGNYEKCVCNRQAVSCGYGYECASRGCNNTVCTSCKLSCQPSCSSYVSSCPSGQVRKTSSDGCGGTCSWCEAESKCGSRKVYFRYKDYKCWESNAGNCGKAGMYAWVESCDRYCVVNGKEYYIDKANGSYRNGRCFDTIEECRANPGAVTNRESAYDGASCCIQ